MIPAAMAIVAAGIIWRAWRTIATPVGGIWNAVEGFEGFEGFEEFKGFKGFELLGSRVEWSRFFKLTFRLTAADIENPEPLPAGDALLVRGDSLGLACRREGVVADAASGGLLAHLPGQTGSGGEGLAQPGAGVVGDGAPNVPIFL
jgi:hypothetical protein